jgi:hypothetical protein
MAATVSPSGGDALASSTMRAPLLLLRCVAVAVCTIAIDCNGTFSTEAGQAADADASAAGGGAGTANAGGSTTGGARGSGALASGGVGTGGRTGSGGQGPVAEAGPPKTLDIELTITEDRDDATWIGGEDERLSYATDQPFVEVGADSERARAAFRFELPIPPSSIIESAVLRLHHVDGDAAETETTLVQVYDSASVPLFDGDHVHAPSEHATGGVWPLLVSGFAVGLAGSEVESPDLAVLVQHVINRPDWTSGGSIAFLLSPETLSGWVGFGDSASGAGARLRVTYTPPFR